MIASVLPLLCLTTQFFALTASGAAFPRDESHTTTTNATAHVLQYHHMGRGHKIKPGTELRILPVGDSITVGFHSNLDGGDGNGYRLKLKENLSGTSLSPFTLVLESRHSQFPQRIKLSTQATRKSAP